MGKMADLRWGMFFPCEIVFWSFAKVLEFKAESETIRRAIFSFFCIERKKFFFFFLRSRLLRSLGFKFQFWQEMFVIMGASRFFVL